MLYIGFTENLKKRLVEHNIGRGANITSVKNGWKIIYCEGYTNKMDALGREKFLKGGSGRKYLKKQLNHYFRNL
jgi:predicted GIY-YIG superfamily endonuclease